MHFLKCLSNLVKQLNTTREISRDEELELVKEKGGLLFIFQQHVETPTVI